MKLHIVLIWLFRLVATMAYHTKTMSHPAQASKAVGRVEGQCDIVTRSGLMHTQLLGHSMQITFQRAKGTSTNKLVVLIYPSNDLRNPSKPWLRSVADTVTLLLHKTKAKAF